MEKTMTTEKTETPNPKPQNDDVEIDFEDEKGMYGTSPATSELGDKEVEHLTSQTMPRVRLSRSYKKIFMYMSVLMIMLFMPQLCYYRTSEITGLTPGPIYGLGEMGLIIVCAGLSIANFFMIAPEDADKNIRHAVRVVGTFIPLATLAAIYLLPAELVYRATPFLY